MTNALSFDPHSRLVVAEHTATGAFRELEREWRAIESHAGTPFASWDWAVAWWARLREEKLGVTDSLSIRTVRTHDGRLIGVSPMLISRRPSVGPICVRQLQFFGADPNITEQRGMIALPEWQSEAYGALVDHALRNANAWDCMLLSGVPVDLDLRALANSTELEWLGQTADYTLNLGDSWAAFRSALPRNIKESLRKCYNSLKRDGLEFQLRVADSVEDVRPALERFFALHAARAEVNGTIRHNDVFATP